MLHEGELIFELIGSIWLLVFHDNGLDRRPRRYVDASLSAVVGQAN
jgi:hypothetical protein